MIIAVAGRRVDAPGATVRRFPAANVPTVRTRLKALFAERHARVVVASAACGADLLALDVAGELGLRRRIILPFPRDTFRAASVVDRPGDWGTLFDRICAEVQAHGDLVILPPPASESAGFIGASRAVVDEALALAAADGTSLPGGDAVLAVVVWDGAPRGPDDFTVPFLETAQERHVPIETVLTV